MACKVQNTFWWIVVGIRSCLIEIPVHILPCLESEYGMTLTVNRPEGLLLAFLFPFSGLACLFFISDGVNGCSVLLSTGDLTGLVGTDSSLRVRVRVRS